MDPYLRWRGSHLRNEGRHAQVLGRQHVRSTRRRHDDQPLNPHPGRPPGQLDHHQRRRTPYGRYEQHQLGTPAVPHCPCGGTELGVRPRADPRIFEPAHVAKHRGAWVSLGVVRPPRPTPLPRRSVHGWGIAGGGRVPIGGFGQDLRLTTTVNSRVSGWLRPLNSCLRTAVSPVVSSPVGSRMWMNRPTTALTVRRRPGSKRDSTRARDATGAASGRERGPRRTALC